MIIETHENYILMIELAWPVLLSYACYRIVLAVFARYDRRSDLIEAIVMGLGGASSLWARVLYAHDAPMEWAFALTLLGVALLLTPKLIGIATKAGVGS